MVRAQVARIAASKATSAAGSMPVCGWTTKRIPPKPIMVANARRNLIRSPKKTAAIMIDQRGMVNVSTVASASNM